MEWAEKRLKELELEKKKKREWIMSARIKLETSLTTTLKLLKAGLFEHAEEEMDRNVLMPSLHRRLVEEIKKLNEIEREIERLKKEREE